MNKQIKRIISLILALLIFAAFGVIATAADTGDEPTPRASDYLSYYTVYMLAHSNGEVKIEFEVDGVGTMDSLGINRLVIQEKIDGKWTSLPTIWGSTSNGLVADETYVHGGSYTYEGTSGVEYRAIATVFAGRDGGSDYRTITTNTVTAK